MLEKFGETTRFLLCSPPPTAGLFGSLLGGGESRRAELASALLPGGRSEEDGSRGGSGGILHSTWGGQGEVAYDIVRHGMEAAFDAAEEQALWARYSAQL